MASPPAGWKPLQMTCKKKYDLAESAKVNFRKPKQEQDLGNVDFRNYRDSIKKSYDRESRTIWTGVTVNSNVYGNKLVIPEEGETSNEKLEIVKVKKDVIKLQIGKIKPFTLDFLYE